MKLKAVRKSQNLNAMELAQKAGLDLNQPLMSAMESGKVLPTPNDLQAVCEALQCTPLDLFDNVEEFDLMAVQREMGGRVNLADEPEPEPDYRCPQFTAQEWKFSGMGKPNPKRGFRMSDEDWKHLKAVLQGMGYNSVGQYLKDLLCPYSKRA